MTERLQDFGNDGPVVTVPWLQSHLGQTNVRLIDVRSATDYAAGHIPGAFHSDLHALVLADSAPASIAAFDAALAAEIRRLGIQTGERVIFYEDFSGTSAARGVWLLDYAGLGNGALLDGGLGAWQAAGGELVRAAAVPTPSTIELHPDRSVLATVDELATPPRNGSPPLPLDTRNDVEYAAGTIPNSVHVEWSRHLRPDGTLRPPTELRALYAAAGIEPAGDRDVVTFCGSGFRAAHSYVVLRALGVPRVKNYAPSWNEWGRRPDLPKSRPGIR